MQVSNFLAGRRQLSFVSFKYCTLHLARITSNAHTIWKLMYMIFPFCIHKMSVLGYQNLYWITEYHLKCIENIYTNQKLNLYVLLTTTNLFEKKCEIGNCYAYHMVSWAPYSFTCMYIRSYMYMYLKCANMISWMLDAKLVCVCVKRGRGPKREYGPRKHCQK